MQQQTQQRRAPGRRAAVALVALLVPLALATAAFAKQPTGDFANFGQCPRFTPGVEFCIFAQTSSGSVAIGNTTVPIERTITLQGGRATNEKTNEEVFVGAVNGETLSKTPQKVPGGLLGLVKCNEISNFLVKISCELVFENGLTGVTATTELAKPASEIGINTNNLINEEGTALNLPVKVRLENPFLGSECYIGSSSNPINIPLTTGTTSPPAPNKPISGKAGHVTFKDNFKFLELTEDTLVNNSFAAPAASGCGGLFSFLIDPIIDSKLGLPSASGHNTLIQNNKIEEAEAAAAIASEK